MGRQIIEQPNGLFAEFSSVVDDFVSLDNTVEELIAERIEHEAKEIRRRISSIVAELEAGGKPYHQFTMTFDEAVEHIKELHGPDTESLKALAAHPARDKE